MTTKEKLRKNTISNLIKHMGEVSEIRITGDSHVVVEFDIKWPFTDFVNEINGEINNETKIGNWV